jgi:hypothetical protein
VERQDERFVAKREDEVEGQPETGRPKPETGDLKPEGHMPSGLP